MKILRIRLFLITAILLIICGCQSSQSTYEIHFSESEIDYEDAQDSGPPPIRIAISTVLSPSETVKSYREIASFIGEQLDRPAIVIQRRSYNEINNLMVNGGADIALFPTGAYINYGLHDNLEGIAMQERLGSSYYYGYIITKEDSNIENLEDLRGRNIAFFDPTSYSGYTFVKEKLTARDETPDNFFESHLFTYSHEGSINAVKNNVVDAAAVHSLSYENIEQTDPDLTNDLKIISQSEAMGTGPVLVRSDLPDTEKEIITDSFLHMAEDSSMKQVLQELYIDRFIPFDPGLYPTPGDSDD
ncbi:substrate-binding domain-containing protein [Oceanobacillus jeddahense]|uniref:Phosphate/phosphite/phosphonate ABC transporter substrate-binding protein n=1 Tax=Oceanobacillus jeddahense TaxID=1462527 RepID=A0ABY5JW58_9BACI|nr:phosphate/phosphite/phosphonate ABC transporter substrate-binding protein [Oceanobacillus jeddahense]UUI04625.1 phosphate/phosphite/phosphonate ABC transporter substrate-binding protein [Oceanobacillus jeddahense]